MTIPHPEHPESKPAQATKRNVIMLLGAIVVSAIAATFYFSSSGEKAPQVTFTSLQGTQQSLQDLRGKVVLVNFWATSCTTCVAEMPELVKTYNTYHPKGFETIAVAMSYDRPDYVLNFAQTRQLPFTVSLDVQGQIAKQFGDVRITPTTFLLDKQGNIIRRYLGRPNFEQLHLLIENELKT